MDGPDASLIATLGVAGIAGGVVLLGRGFAGYRAAVRIGDTATSRIGSIAAGEVRVTGVVEPAEATLVSPLQSAPCVWYRSEVRVAGHGRSTEGFSEERAVGFRVRDPSGTIRVFPRDAQFDADPRFREEAGPFDDPPSGLDLRDGPAYGRPEPVDRDSAIATLLSVREPDDGAFGDRGVDALGLRSGGARRYVEARIEPGDVVTIVGTAIPFGHLPDPGGHDRLERSGDPGTTLDDPELAASIARARAADTLLTPEQAWGNAGIPGFGIGMPVRAPELDPRATVPGLATAEKAAHLKRTFDLEPDLLVLAAEPGLPLLVAAGAPADAVSRQEWRFLTGLLGAVLAIASAVTLAMLAGGALAG